MEGTELHKQFVNFCEERGIDLRNAEDYGPWWDCWWNGYETAVSELEEVK